MHRRGAKEFRAAPTFYKIIILPDYNFADFLIFSFINITSVATKTANETKKFA